MDIKASREAWLFFQQLCEPVVGISSLTTSENRKLVRIIDMMGREVKEDVHQVVLYQYSDGSIEKKVVGFH
ncbi:MAG: hypothetical protein QNK70_08760 [Crocinitomicaceae bacterium]